MDLWRDRRLRLTITRLGAEFILAMLLMGAAAVNTGNNLIYLLFSLMLGLFLASGWVSRRAIQDLELLRIEEGNVFARVRGGMKIAFRNGDPARVRGVEIHLEMEGGLVEPGFLAGGERSGPGHVHGHGHGPADGVVVLHLRPPARGWVRLRALEFRTGYPFGFLEKAWRFPLDQRILILPHPRSLPPRQDLEGDRVRPRPHTGASSPDGARPFRDRDPLSRVHWKRTAQRGTPWVRTFEGEEATGVRLRLDLREWQAGSAFERELEILSGSVLQARLQRRQVFLALAALDGRLELEGYTRCWRALAQAEAGGRCRSLA